MDKMLFILQTTMLFLWAVGEGMVIGEGKQCPGSFNCTQGGHVYCFPLPCPLPPCENPVTTPGECCPHCPSTDGDGSALQKKCIPIPPCVPPLCEDSFMPADSCCPVCPDQCTNMCKYHGHVFCYKKPGCPPTPCPKVVLTPGDCCPHCAN